MNAQYRNIDDVLGEPDKSYWEIVTNAQNYLDTAAVLEAAATDYKEMLQAKGDASGEADLMLVELDLMESDTNYSALDSSSIYLIEQIAVNNETACKRAQQILHLLQGDSFIVEQPYLDANNAKNHIQTDNLWEKMRKRKLDENILMLIPNPAQDYVFVEFKYEEYNTCEFRLVDANGKIIYKQDANEGLNQFHIDIREFSSGVYTAVLWCNDSYLSTKQLNVLR